MTIDFTEPSYTHTTRDGQTITVKAINMDGLSTLMQRNGELMEIVFEGGATAADILTRAPRLAAGMIAVAAGEPDATDKAARLPFPLQMILLTEIYRLTFGEIDLGNGIALFMTLAKGMRQGDPKNPPALGI